MMLERYVKDEIVNGGDKFYILDSEQVLKAIEEKKISLEEEFLSIKNSAMNFIHKLEFANEHENFEMAYYYFSDNAERDFYPYKNEYELKYDEKTWLKLMLKPMLLYYINNRYERVEIENLICNGCGCVVRTVTSSVLYLYMNSINKEINEEIFNNTYNIKIIKCPVCGDDKEFKRRHSIWCE